MTTRLCILLASLSACVFAIAQETSAIETPDSLRIECAGGEAAQPAAAYAPLLWLRMAGAPSLSPTLSISPHLYDQSESSPWLENMSGYAGRASLPGLMGIESASLAYTLRLGNISITPSVSGTKHGFYGGLATSYGIGGKLEYRISSRFALSAFGHYESNSWSANPAVMANMAPSRFGGFGTWSINDKWDMSVGAQRVYNAATGQWETIPILAPAFKINGKQAFSMDLGGIIYEIIRSTRADKWGGPCNPTIPPPAKPFAPIR